MIDPLIILANACAVGYVAPCIALPITVAVMSAAILMGIALIVRR